MLIGTQNPEVIWHMIAVILRIKWSSKRKKKLLEVECGHIAGDTSRCAWDYWESYV